jgi:hypothetical protein
MAVTPSKKKSDYRRIAIALAICGLWFLLGSFLPIWHSTAHVDSCPFNAAGDVIPDRAADGVVTKNANMYFAHRAGAPDSLLAKCLDRNACNGPYSQMQGHLGEPVHVEYCGFTVTRVTLSGAEIFKTRPVTLESINATNSHERLALQFMVALCFALSLYYLVKLRRLKNTPGTPQARL